MTDVLAIPECEHRQSARSRKAADREARSERLTGRADSGWIPFENPADRPGWNRTVGGFRVQLYKADCCVWMWNICDEVNMVDVPTDRFGDPAWARTETEAKTAADRHLRWAMGANSRGADSEEDYALEADIESRMDAYSSFDTGFGITAAVVAAGLLGLMVWGFVRLIGG